MRHLPPHFVFTGGGTLGHLTPGLAVAAELRAAMPDCRVTFASVGKSLERKLVRAAGYDFLAVPARPAPRRAGELLPFARDTLVGYRLARRILNEHRPQVVIGLGGYASVPTARAAVALGIPLVLLEQNVVPGRANRYLASRSAAVCVAFDQSRDHLPLATRVHVVGTPVRSDFFEQAAARENTAKLSSFVGNALRGVPECHGGHSLQEAVDDDMPNRPRRLLVLGGSGGARQLNESVPLALYRCGQKLAHWQVLHQSGEADEATTSALYRKLAIDATVRPFLSDMPAELAASDLVISRAGGTTLAELSAVGRPAVLVPYPHAADDHQRHNARAYAATRAVRIVDSSQGADRLDAVLAAQLAELLESQSVREAHARQIARWARPAAAGEVAAIVRRVATANAASAAA